MNELVTGLIGISIVLIFLKFETLRHPRIKYALVIGVCLRIILGLLSTYVIPLPDSNIDAMTFYTRATEFANIGLYQVLSETGYGDGWVYSRIVGIIFSITGKSFLLMQSFSFFASMLLIRNAFILGNKAYGRNYGVYLAWIIAIFPSLVLYGSINLREVFIALLVSYSLIHIVNWSNNNSLGSLLMSLFFIFLAGYLHIGLIAGAFGILFYVLLEQIVKFSNEYKGYLLNKYHILIILFFSWIFFDLYVFDIWSLPRFIPYFGDLNNNILGVINDLSMSRHTGSAAYPYFFVTESVSEFLLLLPLKIVYFLFSPFLWDINKPIHILGYIDGLLISFATLIMLININKILKNRSNRIIIFSLIFIVLTYAIVTSNFGTALRHRSKIVLPLFLISIPYINQTINSLFRKWNK